MVQHANQPGCDEAWIVAGFSILTALSYATQNMYGTCIASASDLGCSMAMTCLVMIGTPVKKFEDTSK